MRGAFKDRLAVGREIEKAVAAWLMKRGQRILPVYDYCGLANDKAPKMSAAKSSDSLVLPDLLGAHHGKIIWFEVKYKERADYTRITQRLETGIDKRLWDDYCKVQSESGSPVWLLFAHKRENELRAGPIEELQQDMRVYTGPRMTSGGMVFFNYSKLRLLASLSDIVGDIEQLGRAKAS